MSARPSTALIADDEEAPREQLVRELRAAWPGLDIVAVCVNGAEAWDAFLEHEPQVCFLDVRMPGLTGIEVAQRIGGRAATVFVTAHGDHALDAFDAGAVDYLLKPIDPSRMARTVERLAARLATPPADESAGLQRLLDRLASQVRRPAPLDVLQASVGKEIRLVRVDDVVYFEADARYTRVVDVERGKDAELLIRTPLKELLTQLDPARFWQVHRSVIVSQRHIASALRTDDGNMVLSLRDRSERLPVSRHFQGLFKGQ